ncbi:acyl-CoA thioesterase [Flavobacteriaceae bacterium M23B6Z8]
MNFKIDSSAALPKTLRSKHRIRFQDCDPFNHLNNGRYMDYFMNAREDQLEKAYHFPIYQYAKETGKSWVVAENRIRYIKPALLMEEVFIDTQLIAFSDHDLQVEMRMLDSTKEALKAIAWCTFIHFDMRSQKKSVHEENLIHLFTNVHNPIETVDFQERISGFIRF